jgi:putative membrane protein
MKPLLKLLITSLAIIITAYFFPGVRIADFWTAITVAVAMGIVNTIIKPIVLFFTLPLNILTLGLFTFVVNGALIMLIAFFIPGFQIEGFFTAVIFSILVMIINWILIKLTV